MQYTERVDAVIYSDAASDFTRDDWLRLAMAALDQASPFREPHKYAASRVALMDVAASESEEV